jgi:hypothetical protein
VFANEDQWEEFDTVLPRLSCDCDLHATVSERMNELWTKPESGIKQVANRIGSTDKTVRRKALAVM